MEKVTGRKRRNLIYSIWIENPICNAVDLKVVEIMIIDYSYRSDFVIVVSSSALLL